MLGIHLLIVFALYTAALGQHSPIHYDSNIDHDAVLHRFKRFFPLFSVVRFPNSQCISSNSFIGTCLTKRECLMQGGTTCGSCANGFGVCCVFQKMCGATASMNNTYFTNPSYPKTFDGGERCTISVHKYEPNICQLRLDFLDFSIAQPTSEGLCDYDLLSITGSSSSIPRICGENADQHVYVEFDESKPITISIDTSTEYSMKRRWNIRIQQIACDSAWRAPTGCLQYFTSVSGIVTSFNYGTVSNSRLSTDVNMKIGSREISNLNYGACIRIASGYCSLKWSATTSNSFSVTGDLTMNPASGPVSGASCTTDFIIIPNSIDNGIATNTERFCGSSFTEKITSLKPFVLYVVTDNAETTSAFPDTENKGFSLMYKQMICSI